MHVAESGQRGFRDKQSLLQCVHMAESDQRGFRNKQLLLSCVHIVENGHHYYEGSLTSPPNLSGGFLELSC